MSALQWFEFIASCAIQVVLVVTIAATLDRWTVSPSVKARLWNTCFLSLLGMMAIGLLLPRLHLFHPWSAFQPTSLLMVAQVESVLGACMLVTWTFGSAVMLIRWAMRFTILHRFVQSCPRLSAPQSEALVRRIPAELLTVGNRRVEFRVCPEEFAPFCYQFHRPIVFLPGNLLESDREILANVVYHELTHLHTNHPMQLFCQKLVQCLLWFHPLVWMSSYRASLTREFVCDEASARFAGSTTAYLKALVAVAKETLRRQEGTLAISHTKKDLLMRVSRLSRSLPSASTAKGHGAIGIVVIAALLCAQLWLPTNPLASHRSSWSPWPTWSAEALHAVNVSARDYEVFSRGNQLHEWIEDSNEPESLIIDPRFRKDKPSF